ncbi:hypothetical protein AGR2A_Cc160015 [Agrobacterium genomosp. 2 str. CFBP 5494]|uniref:Uncharacterized protein n=1 Tax=Agrobacterium genomosp. 2 str. CFBP 5494 TaxID=1183436 RepID=A0A9W5AZV8_9HYPH|nr:hypothetical protein AGR2A_Cc160015 [Agrobacterium genomosp. 2 str. CFBP 5494]
MDPEGRRLLEPVQHGAEELRRAGAAVGFRRPVPSRYRMKRVALEAKTLALADLCVLLRPPTPFRAGKICE